MIDRYLCKGKRTDGEWVEGYFVKFYANGDNEPEYMIFTIYEDEKRSQPYSVIPGTICRYTGLHDRTKWEELSEKEQQQFLSEWNYEKDRRNQKEDWKGKKIWENDIVKVQHEKYPESPDTEFDLLPTATVYTRNYAVEFINTGSNYGYRCRNRSIHFLITKNMIYNHKVEVIGNIFDNSELLDGGKDAGQQGNQDLLMPAT